MEKKITVMKVGNIELSDDVVVSDPCSDKEVWDTSKNITVKPGVYEAYVVKLNTGDAGTRVACIMAVHTDYINMMDYGWKICTKNTRLDSGQCGIFDDTIFPVDEQSLGDFGDGHSFYDECCNLTIGDELAGILKSRKGVVSSTGCGGGVYDLCFQSYGEYCVALLVDFGLVGTTAMTDAVLES